MSGQGPATHRAIQGTIRRRLLVNTVVDPEEAADHLPAGLRPHVSDGGTVVGCCLLDIERIRPAPLPSVLATSLRAAAHRISVEWDDEAGIAVVGVYVPVRHTDSRVAIVLGGRWFPGVHRRAAIALADSTGDLSWTVDPLVQASSFGIRALASVSRTPPSTTCEPIGATCLSATIGLSPNHQGVLEAARMQPDHRRAEQVVIEHVESEFLARFTTARPAPSYLMRDVGVTWTPASAPASHRD